MTKTGVLALCLMSAALLRPSRQEGAPIGGAEDRPRPSKAAPANHNPSPTQRARALESYGNLPLGFEANQGQSDRRVNFLSHSGRLSLFLTSDESVLALPAGQPARRGSGKLAAPAILRMQLLGSSAAATMEGVDELPGRTNYFIGNDPARWRTNVPNFRKVVERGVYPGIDLVYYGTERQLEYDFVLAPGAGPRAIQLAFQGAGQLRLDAQGNLIAGLGGAEVSFERPVAYQEASDGRRRAVDARYVIKDGRRVAFEVGKYDARRALVIDPVLSYSTYLGGSQADAANGIAVDSSGSAYVTGQTCSTDFPTQTGSYQTTAPGSCDAFVTKLNPAGTALVYSTYLGGSNSDYGAGIAVDSSDFTYVTGFTSSTDFPTTTGAFQTGYGGGSSDVFVTKLNAAGSGLEYSTYLGGSGSDNPGGIAVDSSGNALVAGETCSGDFPLMNALQPTYGGNCDAFVTKLDSLGDSPVYSTYLGGSHTDAAYGIAVDSAGSAYVAGATISTDFPVLNAFQSVAPGCTTDTFPCDAFVTKIDTNGDLIYSTYLGGGNQDEGNAIAVDTQGNAYVTGYTTSTNFPVSAGAYDPTCKSDGACNPAAGGQPTPDVFVSKLDDKGTALVYSTYLGGSGADQGNGIAVDTNGIAYVAGVTESADFPTANPIQPTSGGGASDAFVTKLDAAGTGLIFSSYLGGNDADAGKAIAVDSSANAYVAGSTSSVNFLTTSTAFAPSYVGNGDAFVAKLTSLASPVTVLSPMTLTFGDETIGSTSTAQNVTLTNAGDATLNIVGIDASGDFAETNTCGTSLAAGANCTISVTFTPSLAGVRDGAITLTDNAASSPQTVTLTGNGIANAAVTFNPAALTFASQVVGTTSAPQTITLTNTGAATLSIASIVATGDFTATNNCPASLPIASPISQNYCTITVTFAPTAAGTRTGSIVVTDNAPGSPQTAQLMGVGQLAPVVNLSPSTLTFTGQAVGTTSAAQTVTLTNSGSGALTISNVVAAGDFAQTNTCGASVPAAPGPGNTCTFSVTFTPTASGNRYGSVTITDNAGNSPQVILLAGSGSANASAAFLPSSLSFVNQIVGTTSAIQSLVLTNTGGASMSISSIAATGDFAEVNSCGGTLASGASCTISVTFTPTAAGPRAGSIVVADNAPGSPQSAALSGNGVAAPLVSLSPTNLTFSGQAVGTTSAAQTVTLANTGKAALTFTSITTNGDFAQTNTCPASLGAGLSCVISVTFTPTAAGNRYGSLIITDNASDSPETIPLAGNGVPIPVVALAPASLTFTNQIVNTTSAPQSVVLSNTGNAPLSISGITASGDFGQTNNCGSSVASGSSCTISVTFAPTAAGSRTGAVTIADNAAGGSQSIPLTGTGILAPVVTLSPSTLTFTGQAVGTSSDAQTVTLTNSGSGALSISNVVAAGDFTQTNTCGAGVPAAPGPGNTCTFSVTFTPTASGNRYGSVTITDNAGNSPQVILLAGSGSANASAAFLPSSLSFGNQIVGTTSAIQSLVLTNTGGASMSISSIAATGDFAEVNSCGGTLASGASCTISVTFTPTAAGPRTGSIVVTDNAPGSPQTAPLTGTGILAPVVNLSPSTLTFLGQAVGTTSAAQTVTLTNSGSGPLTISNVVAAGDFAQTNTCGASVAAAPGPGNTCTFSVTFAPTVSGDRYGSITITDNAGNSPQVIPLAGSGSANASAAFLPSSLSFANQIVGTTSGIQSLALTNTGGASMSISSIAATGDFAEVNSCGGTLASGASCTINVMFTPTAAGPRAGTIVVTDNAPGSPQSVAVSGTGVAAPLVSLSPTSLTFSGQSVGATSAVQTVTLTNTGKAALTFTSITTNGDFAQTDTCPASLGAGLSCVISVTFTPTASGNRYGSLIITDNASDSPETIPLAGDGLPTPVVEFTPASLTFTNQIVNTTSAPQSVVLSNTGNAPLSISGITASGDFGQTNNCGSSVASGHSCTISVTFTPAAAGPRAGAVTVADNAAGGSQSIPLTGTGILAPVVKLSPNALTFSGQAVGSTSAPLVVTLTNTGASGLNIISIVASGDFTQTNTCGASVGPGIACAINVTFSPTALGSRYGSVVITDNAADSPQTVLLAGNGKPAPVASLTPASLTFSSQPVGIASAAQAVTLSNTGTAVLLIAGISVSGDFAQLNTCGSSLAAGASCVIDVTFTPSAAGSRTGQLTITDNAPTSPQEVTLGGSGADFTVSTTPSSASVVAGNSVSFTLSIAPLFGFNAPVRLGCSGAPRDASCSVSPITVTPNGTSPATATVTVATAQRSLAPPGLGPDLDLPHLWRAVRPTGAGWLLLLLAVLLASQAIGRRRRAVFRFALAAALVLLWVACGGGGTQVDLPSGTPAGNYTLTVSGTSGLVTRSAGFNLTVQ